MALEGDLHIRESESENQDEVSGWASGSASALSPTRGRVSLLANRFLALAQRRLRPPKPDPDSIKRLLDDPLFPLDHGRPVLFFKASALLKVIHAGAHAAPGNTDGVMSESVIEEAIIGWRILPVGILLKER